MPAYFSPKENQQLRVKLDKLKAENKKLIKANRQYNVMLSGSASVVPGEVSSEEHQPSTGAMPPPEPCKEDDQPTKELIREISLLELQVKNLEQYLLTLYRKAFDQQVPNLPPISKTSKISENSINSINNNNPKSNKLTQEQQQQKFQKKRTSNPITDDCVTVCKEKPSDQDPTVVRSQSSLSQRAVCSARISPSEESLARALRSFHYQPFSFLEIISGDSKLRNTESNKWHNSADNSEKRDNFDAPRPVYGNWVLSYADTIGSQLSSNTRLKKQQQPQQQQPQRLSCLDFGFSRASPPPEEMQEEDSIDDSIWLKQSWSIGEIPERPPPLRFCT